MGKLYLKPGSGLAQPSAATPIVNRPMDKEPKTVCHTEANLNLRIIVPTINNNNCARIVTTPEDPVSCLDDSALQPNPPTLTKANAPHVDSRRDSSCPGSRIISMKREGSFHSESGLNLKKRVRLASDTNWLACNGVLANRDPLIKESVRQQTTFEVTRSPKGSLYNENAINVNNESSTVDNDNEPSVADINNDSITVDIDNEPFVNESGYGSIIVDSDLDLIDSSNDVSISHTQRFDRMKTERVTKRPTPSGRLDGFSHSDVPPTVRWKVPIDENLTLTSHGEPSSDSLLGASHCESNRYTGELLLEASAKYRLSRKLKISFTDTDPAKTDQATVLDSPRPDETSETSALDQTKHPTAKNDVISQGGTNETVAQNTLTPKCRLPFNSHSSSADHEHYRLCNIILAGIVLRGEHTSWLSDIPSDLDTMPVLNFIIGASCKQIILGDKCSKEHCSSKIDLNLSIQDKSVHVFIKWFLQNAQQPHLKVILLLLSRAVKDPLNVLMIVLTFSKMIVKLSNRIYRQALCIKLKEIMVNVLRFKPWEAVRTLLVFTVTPKTELTEILDLLSVLEVASKKPKNNPLKNRLYESISCLWHINDRFVCPGDLLLKVLKECLVQMPVELKLTKDRMVADLLKLPRKALRSKRFLIVDKFLVKYYPQNSAVAHLVKSSILCKSDVSKTLRDCRLYGTSRVRVTGPVNPQWDHWDIREAQMEGFDFVMKNSQKDKPHEERNLRLAPMNLSIENFDLDEWRHDLYKIVWNRNTSCYEATFPSNDFDYQSFSPSIFRPMVDLLIARKFRQVVDIISSCGDPNLLETCLETLKQTFVLGDSAGTALEILKRLPGSLTNKTSVKSSYIRMLNSLVVDYYKDSECKTAVKYLTIMKVAGVYHRAMALLPEQADLQTFAVICADIHLQCSLYREAICCLQYENCLNLLGDPNSNPEQHNLLEKVVKNMFRLFLKERHASLAIDIFRTIFAEQKSLHSPLDIGKYFEGVIFLSFVKDLKKNACSAGAGANLYTVVERVCGNSEPFHSITYRSLLVELHREKSPEDTIKRVFRICLERKIYPDFSRGPIYPLDLNSNLAKEEISIYLKYYFAHFIARNDLHQLKTNPLLVRFYKSPRLDRKVFSVPNDIMKTSRSVRDALERFKSVLNEISPMLDADFARNFVTLSAQDVETLIRVFSR